MPPLDVDVAARLADEGAEAVTEPLFTPEPDDRLADRRLMAPERLQKVIAASGVASRRASEVLIANGRVTVDGKVASIGAQVDGAKAIIAVDGRVIGAARSRVPAPAQAGRRDLDGPRPPCRQTVLDYLRRRSLPEGARLYPVGRLDLDSEGLLILTNDGEWSERVLHPRYGVEREYAIGLRGRSTASRSKPSRPASSSTRASRHSTGLRATTEVETGWPSCSATARRHDLVSRDPRPGLEAPAPSHVRRGRAPIDRLVRVRIGPVRIDGLRPVGCDHSRPPRSAAWAPGRAQAGRARAAPSTRGSQPQRRAEARDDRSVLPGTRGDRRPGRPRSRRRASRDAPMAGSPRSGGPRRSAGRRDRPRRADPAAGPIDAHAHVSSDTERSPLWPAAMKHGADLRPRTSLLRLANMARAFLRAGITTVRDVGSYDNEAIVLRGALELGLVDGPRLLSCGRILTATRPAPGSGTMYREADGPWKIRKAVREQIRDGADYIKIMATGARSVERETRSRPDDARGGGRRRRRGHRMGYRVAAHAEGLAVPGTRSKPASTRSSTACRSIALRAARRMAERGIVLSDPVDVLRPRRTVPAEFAPRLVEQAKRQAEDAARTLVAAQAAGVTLAMGYDSGPPGASASELVRMATPVWCGRGDPRGDRGLGARSV